ncbi:MAG: hypothetical protein KGO92_06405, partial [Bacteroidota bacterium]|nr:hypothetical protein [Bacteroidota bacterium]
MRFTLLLCILLSFISIPSIAQKPVPDFSGDWTVIDSLILQKGLTRSALEKTHALYKKAKTAGRTDEMIRSLVYQYSLEEKINDEDPSPAINRIQAELKNTNTESEKAILHVLLAKAYQRYFNNHRWELYGRKNTIDRNDTTIQTWSPDDFRESITHHYLEALRMPQLLQKEKLTRYSAILIKGNQPALRPTLFDLLTNEALAYFRSGESYVTLPSFSFELTDQRALGGIDAFLATAFATKDSSSHLWLCLNLFQQLIRFHLKDADKTALLDADLDRIAWVNETGLFSHKNQAYKQALEDIIHHYGSEPSSAQASYLLARAEADQAATYRPFHDTTFRYGYVTAKNIATRALQNKKGTNAGIVNLQNLLLEIDRKEFHTELEKVNIPGKPFRALVSYRNMDTIYQRIIRMPEDIQRGDKYWSTVTSIQPIRTLRQVLPVITDHQQHSVEIKIDGLPAGYYALLSSTTPDFNPDKDKISLHIFHVSRISYLRNRNDFFVLDRETGQPLSQVKVAVLYQSYDYAKKSNYNKQIGKYLSDSMGHFKYDPSVNLYQSWFHFSKGGDTLEMRNDDPVYFDNYERLQDPARSIDSAHYVQSANRVFFFTDRAIYRPGQLLFFKGIAITKDFHTHLSKLIQTKDSSWLYLIGANNKQIDSLRVGINEYGSFTGSFRLPMNGLTGNFRLQLPHYNYSGTDFNVEEYKRPQFSVHFEKNNQAYRL